MNEMQVKRYHGRLEKQNKSKQNKAVYSLRCLSEHLYEELDYKGYDQEEGQEQGSNGVVPSWGQRRCDGEN